jgi:transposase-like protein
MTTRKKYSKEFKLDVISLVLGQGYSQTEACLSTPVYSEVQDQGISLFKGRAN